MQINSNISWHNSFKVFSPLIARKTQGARNSQVILVDSRDARSDEPGRLVPAEFCTIRSEEALDWSIYVAGCSENKFRSNGLRESPSRWCWGASVRSLGWNGEHEASPIGQTGVGGFEMPLGFSPILALSPWTQAHTIWDFCQWENDRMLEVAWRDTFFLSV